ncbi:hypothetical protein DFJ58DRAFT_908875 [Suillus subalutaceus]|uniref:uncharacterized protein n=1 Tax=Suillus subalutaceus TaxID=48586 RepID=UPI001B8652BB|nr:uncharacterized protein DFJ58DRAFT_908875 [Suillus subalutaceus]KAG1829917.1 hypothetical protein DFJ58DRAFT_908875 [Suillus subalutaceus]
MRLAVLLCVFLYLVGVIQATPTTNATNATTSSDTLKAPSFTTRTLWAIVSNSVITVYACIYTAIHPNIPSPKDSTLTILRRRLWIMIVALLAPELIVVWTTRQWLNNTWTQTHSFFVLMGGFMLYVDEEPYCPLQPNHMLKLIHEGCIDAPTLTANEINDKSKGNAISKGLFVMQFVTRVIYHLRITQLEVGTFIFAVFTFLTYAMWWNKPLDVQCSHPVYWKLRESRPEDYIDVPDADELIQLGIWAPVLRPAMELLGLLIAVPASRKLRVRTLDGSVNHGDSDKVVLILAVELLETLFGVMHCMAWSFHFPTPEEQVLWRISAVGLACGPLLCIFAVFILNALEISLASLIRISILARTILLLLMCTTLRDLPHGSDVFDVVWWTSLVPHL